MILVKNGLILFVAIQHIAFLVLEMFFWTKPVGLKIFRQSLENAQVSAVLAANQGLYNGFLAAGLIWSLMHPDILFAKQLAVFFLACVICAGAYGAYTVNLRLFFVQGLPAMIALAAVLILA